MRPVTVWVLASPRDPGLHVLDPAPAGVTFMRGAAREDFAGAPAPDAVFVCSMRRSALAEFAIAALLFFAKGVRRMLRSQAEGKWDPFDLEPLAGRTLGIVGYGDIGRAIAQKARAFDMRVIALRRRPEASAGNPLLPAVLPL